MWRFHIAVSLRGRIFLDYRGTASSEYDARETVFDAMKRALSLAPLIAAERDGSVPAIDLQVRTYVEREE